MLNSEQKWIKAYDKPLLIAGPCSAESELQMMTIAKQLPKDYVQVFRAGIWKPRTKPGSFEGVGKIGLNWLKKVKDEFGFQTTTEVGNAEHVKYALEADVDILWVGARTTVNPFTIQEIAEALQGTDKVVLVKNPINPDLELWIGALERLAGEGVQNLGAIHRGFSNYKKTKYRNVPNWQIALDFKNRLPEIPMICDPSHIAGRRDLIQEVSQQAFNFEFNGLMVETHHIPDDAWSDAKQQITPTRLYEMVKELELRRQNDTDSSYRAELDALRHQIDDADRHLLEVLSDRMKVVEKIGELKKEHNIAVFQPERWSSLKQKLVNIADEYNLSPEFVIALLSTVHQESVMLQNKIMADKAK